MSSGFRAPFLVGNVLTIEGCDQWIWTSVGSFVHAAFAKDVLRSASKLTACIDSQWIFPLSEIYCDADISHEGYGFLKAMICGRFTTASDEIGVCGS
jgi:hypothetical protein